MKVKKKKKNTTRIPHTNKKKHIIQLFPCSYLYECFRTLTASASSTVLLLFRRRVT